MDGTLEWEQADSPIDDQDQSSTGETVLKARVSGGWLVRVKWGSRTLALTFVPDVVVA